MFPPINGVILASAKYKMRCTARVPAASSLLLLRKMPHSRTPVRVDAAHAFALEHLGLKSHSYLKADSGEAELADRLRQELSIEDATLGAVFAGLHDDTALASEFFGYFASVLLQSNRSAMNGPLAKIYDRDDLVQSVMGDVFPKMGDLSFQSSGQFLAYLLQKLTWKRMDKFRHHGAAIRDYERNIPIDSPASDERSALVLPDPNAYTPLTQLAQEEDEGRVVLALNRLSPQAQSLLRHRLEGGSLDQQYADELGVGLSSLRKQLERARALLQRELERMRSPNSEA